MRDLMKRLERLEGEVTGKPERRVWKISFGKAPSDPARVQCGGEEITREANEAPEAFEARALARFPVGHVWMFMEARCAI